MPAIVLFVVLAVLTALLVKAVLDARGQMPAPPRSEPLRPRRPVRRPGRPAGMALRTILDQEGFAEHIKKLRTAVRERLITPEEAVGSIVRQAGGQVSEQAARNLLEQERENPARETT